MNLKIKDPGSWQSGINAYKSFHSCSGDLGPIFFLKDPTSVRFSATLSRKIVEVCRHICHDVLWESVVVEWDDLGLLSWMYCAPQAQSIRPRLSSIFNSFMFWPNVLEWFLCSIVYFWWYKWKNLLFCEGGTCVHRRECTKANSLWGL